MSESDPNLLAKWSLEIAAGAAVLALGLLRWIGKGVVDDLRELKNSQIDVATKNDIQELRSEMTRLHERIDGLYERDG